MMRNLYSCLFAIAVTVSFITNAEAWQPQKTTHPRPIASIQHKKGVIPAHRIVGVTPKKKNDSFSHLNQ